MSFLSKSSSQGASKGSKAPPSKGAEGTGSSFPSNSSKMENLVAERSEGNKKSSDSQQPFSNNENPETDTEHALSKSVDDKTTFKPKDSLDNISEKECQDSTISESNMASSDSQQPSSNNENPETDTEQALSKSVDDKTTFKPKDSLDNISEKECQDSTISESNKASSDSQQPSSNNENPETDTEQALSKSVDDKTTFKPKDSLDNISEKKCQDSTISESKASSDSQQPSLNNENPETHTEPAFSQGAEGKTFKPKELLEEESQYWTISEMDGTAELLEVCWLDVTGSMTATKGKAYEISFILSMNEENSFGWEDIPVYVMARIGEEGEYKRVKIDLSKLGLKEEEFPAEKCRVEFRSGENAKNDKDTLYFGLYEVWTNKWKAGLRIHEAIVREFTAEDSASTSNTRSNAPGEFVAQKPSVHDLASKSSCRIS